MKNNTFNEADFMKHVVGDGKVGILTSTDSAGNISRKIIPASSMVKAERPSLYNMVALIGDMWGVEHETAKQWMIEALATETLEEAA